MSSEVKAVKKIINDYYNSMYWSDGNLVRKTFHKDAKITGYLDDKLLRQSVEDFASFVENQIPSPEDKNDPIIFEVIMLEVGDTTAVAKVRDNYIGIIFIDILSLIKTESGWLIYNKLFEKGK